MYITYFAIKFFWLGHGCMDLRLLVQCMHDVCSLHGNPHPNSVLHPVRSLNMCFVRTCQEGNCVDDETNSVDRTGLAHGLGPLATRKIRSGSGSQNPDTRI
jgi:hypothetical protein